MSGLALFLRDPVYKSERFVSSIGTRSVVGNSKDVQIFVDDIRCSPVHALLEAQADGNRVTVIDLGSRFGTYTQKGARVQEHTIAVGESIVIGSQTLVLRPTPKDDPSQVAMSDRSKAKPVATAKSGDIGLITDRTLLQATLFWGEQPLEVRTFESGSDLTVGPQKHATFCVSLMDSRFHGAPFAIAHYAQNELLLNVPPEMSGLIWVGQDPIALDTLRNKAPPTRDNPELKVRLRLGDRAELHLGELTLSFVFVNPSEKIPTPVFRVTDQILLRVFIFMMAFYGLVFVALNAITPEEEPTTLKDVPKHLKRVVMDAGIAQAMKKQRAAIGELAMNNEGGRARGEEGRAKAENNPREAEAQQNKAMQQKALPKKAGDTKVAQQQEQEADLDLDAAFNSTTKKALSGSVSVVGKRSDGNTATALADGGFARGRVGEGSGGGGQSVGIGALSGLSTGGGMGSGDYGLSPSKGREIKIPEGEELVILGGLDPDVIASIIKRYLPQIRHCYETQLSQNSHLKGKVGVSFVIGPNGNVQNATIYESSLNERNTEACIISKVKGWNFPKPRGGGTVGVRYPFLLMSTQDK